MSPYSVARTATTASATLTPAERVQLYFNVLSGENSRGFGRSVDKDLKLISASVEETIFELTVKESHAGTSGHLHVGAAALFLDICTSIALVPSMTWQHLGLSRNLNVTYIHPVPVGATIVIASTVVHVGKHLATIKGVVTDKRDGKVICTAEHLKFNSHPTIAKL